MKRLSRVAFGLLGMALAVVSPAGAQQYDTLSAKPDPGDFVSRADSRLTLLGDPIRFSGADVPWLGLRPGATAADPPHVPTPFEIHDILLTLQALGGTVIRARTLAGSVGCAQCIEPAPGKFADPAFAQLDLVLMQARDLGLKLILPLAGGPDIRARSGAAPTGSHPANAGQYDCAPLSSGGRVPAEPYGGGICTYVRSQPGATAASFFTDQRLRDAFLHHVTTVLEHVNSLTGIAYADDPTILAWENCDACAVGADPVAVKAWVELVGQAVHHADRHHLYENGAFAGSIGPDAPHPAPLDALVTPSVDIVGDRLAPSTGHPVASTTRGAAGVGASVIEAKRVFMMDALGWSPADWNSQADFEAILAAFTKARELSGVLFPGLQGHAQQGGYLPAIPPDLDPEEGPALYFPGTTTKPVAGNVMDARARALRHLGYDLAEIMPTPNFSNPKPPEIISAAGGRVSWRGSAGALSYSIERTGDLLTPGSWQLVCDRCVTDATAPWQDPAPPKTATWYRVSAVSPNNHLATPSTPMPIR